MPIQKEYIIKIIYLLKMFKIKFLKFITLIFSCLKLFFSLGLYLNMYFILFAGNDLKSCTYTIWKTPLTIFHLSINTIEVFRFKNSACITLHEFKICYTVDMKAELRYEHVTFPLRYNAFLSIFNSFNVVTYMISFSIFQK